MPNIDKDWVVNQLVSNNIEQKLGNSIVALLKTWTELEIDSPEKQQKVVDIFSKLSLGRPLVEQKKEDENWIVARPGAIKVGDEIMVRSDAYTGELGTIHNGRRGRVVAVRYGDIIINSTDGLEPELKGTHHNPIHLMKLVK